MFGLSPMHLLILLAIVVVVFGTKKLPSVGKDLGNALRGFKEGLKDPEELKKEEAKALENKTAEQPKV